MGKNFFGGGGKQSSSSESWLHMADPSMQETSAKQNDYNAFNQLTDMVNLGPSQGAVQKSNQANTQLTNLLQSFAKGGWMPTQDNFNTANKFTNDAFAAQQTSLDQNFYDQGIQAKRQAALLGRPVNDPILQNKLMQEQTRQQQMLDSQKQSYASNFALNIPQQQLGYTQQLADFQNNLATQAMRNRTALLSVGNQLLGSERQWRAGTAKQEYNGTQKGPGTSFLGGLSQLAATGGGIASAVSGFGGLGGGGGGGGGNGSYGSASIAGAVQGRMAGSGGFVDT